MALVKKSTLQARKARPLPPPAAPDVPAPRVRRSAADRGKTVVQRIDQATQELASGLAEASAASVELQRSMDRISSGAEEAAGAAQESLGSITALGTAFQKARDRADAAGRQAASVQIAFAEASAQIDSSVAAIELNARRQLATVQIIDALENAATDIGGIGQAVSDLSEQTSLLALNASIEAARAGDGGAAFAVVADEVRALAENSETNAGDIQALAASIAGEVQIVAARIKASAETAADEARSARDVIGELDRARLDLATIASGAQEILQSAIEADNAAREAERGAEQVASAAEEQSAAAAEAQQAIEQQSVSLDQSQQTADELGRLTEQLEGDAASEIAAQEVAASAEQLSATIQQLSGAAGQIMVAIEQIGRGAEIQAAATQEASTAMAQIEATAALAHERSTTSAERIATVVGRVDTSRDTVAALAAGVDTALADIRAVLSLLAAMTDTGRRIEKITDSLALIAVQTSMLAVSGSVEATRAGEAGQGFATVSADIRKLSRESARNAERASDAVRTMQGRIALVQRDLDQIVGAAESEIVRNRATVERFKLIAADLKSTMASSSEISDEADGILRSVREVQGGTRQIAAAAELAAGAAREASSAARQQSQSAELLAAAVEEIASLATALTGKAA